MSTTIAYTEELLESVILLLNNSWKTREVPKYWKTADDVPILKKGKGR